MNGLLFLLPVLIAVSLVAFPNFWVMVCMLADYYTPWVLMESPIYDAYHNYLVSSLPERPETPLPEIPASEATLEKVRELTKDFTFPLVIRGLLGSEAEGVKKWATRDFWMENYGDEELLCGTFSNVVEDCTIKGFFNALDNGSPFYISGASQIFEKHPNLHKMIDSEGIRSIEPANRTATQMFMGLPDMGSDIHAAIGINVFRQVTGSKKWWFVPNNQTMFLKASINVNGFSAHTGTKVGKGGEQPSPWLNKIIRYTSVVNAGDVLINPPWFWHGILNLGDPKKDIVIGSPVRYGGASTGKNAALKNSPFLTLNTYAVFLYKYGFAALKPGFKFNMQAAIANNRRDRGNKPLGEEPEPEIKEVHPFDEAD